MEEKLNKEFSDFETWVQAQALAQGETRAIIPEAGLIVRTLEGKTFREYYASRVDSHESDRFTLVAKATFFEDHSVLNPHFELETRIADEGHPDITQKVVFNKDKAEYIRNERGAIINARCRRSDGAFIALDEAGYTPSNGAFGIGLNSFEDITALRGTPGVNSEIYGDKYTHARGDEFGVKFTVYDGGKIAEAAFINGRGTFDQALSSFVPEKLLQDPSLQEPELDKWKNADFFKSGSIPLLGGITIHETPRLPTDQNSY